MTTVTHTPPANVPFIKRVIPAIGWLPKYDKSWLSKDGVAGLTLAAFSIPESMAYANIAGLPAEMGLYTAMWTAIIYTFTGTSSRLAVGPTSGLSATMAAGLVAFASVGTDQYIELAAATAILVGIIAVVAWLLRLGFVVNFISKPVLVGFSAGAAFYITGTQLGDLFGIEGGEGGFFSQVGYIIQNLDETNTLALALGLATIVILLIADRFLPKLPNSLIVVVLAIALISLMGWEDQLDTVGEIPQGLPSLAIPTLTLSEWLELAPLALSLFLLGVGEHVGIARSFGNKYKERTEANQEMFAIGWANIVSGIGSGYVGAGSMSRSTVNDDAGARSWISGLVQAAAIVVVLLVLYWFFANLAMAVLAGVVIVAVSNLVDVPEIQRIYRLNRREFVVLSATFLIVTGIGLLEGLIVGIVLGLIDILGRVSSPHTAILGRVPGTNKEGDVKTHPDDVEEIPGVLVYRVDAALFYANASAVQDEIAELVAGTDPPVKLVVMELRATPILDITGADTLEEIANSLAGNGLAFKVIDANESVRDAILADGLENILADEIPLDQDEVELVQEWLAEVEAAQNSLSEQASPQPEVAEKQ